MKKHCILVCNVDNDCILRPFKPIILLKEEDVHNIIKKPKKNNNQDDFENEDSDSDYESTIKY